MILAPSKVLLDLFVVRTNEIIHSHVVLPFNVDDLKRVLLKGQRTKWKCENHCRVCRFFVYMQNYEKLVRNDKVGSTFYAHFKFLQGLQNGFYKGCKQIFRHFFM